MVAQAAAPAQVAQLMPHSVRKGLMPQLDRRDTLPTQNRLKGYGQKVPPTSKVACAQGNHASIYLCFFRQQS